MELRATMELSAENTEHMLIDRAGTLQRIAVIAPGLDILGGQGIQASALMNALRREGLSIDFIPMNPQFPTGLRWLRKIPYLRTLLNQLLYRMSLKRIARADMVHLFSASYWSFLLAQVPAIKAGERYGKPIVLNYHSGEADDHLGNWGNRVHPWLERVHKIVVPSIYLKQVFAKYGYDAQVIPNIVHLEQFNYRLRTPLQPKILSVRNLEPIYRIDNTLAAFALIKEKYPAATLTVAGYGSMEASLKKLVRDKCLTGVHFIGRVEPANIASVYDTSDIFINSSVVDNQPVSILEAFAAGLPVVSTPTGDIAYMVKDMENGMLVPADQPEKIASAVGWLLENSHQAGMMTARARADVCQYTWPQVRTHWLNLYSGEPA